MMVIEIHIDPNGDRSRRRTIESIAVGNITELSDISDYAVYFDSQDVGLVPPHHIIRGHVRSDGALLLAERVLRVVGDVRQRAHRAP